MNNMADNNFVKIAWAGKHFGEEPPLVKDRGAGTIFFTGCNLRCVYCQNYQISQGNIFKKNYSIEELVEIMLGLQKEGALNIDLVSPTIWFRQIKQAIIEAKNQGLAIPVIWNTNAYDGIKVLKEIEGLVDIYLPDFKYGEDDLAFKYSGIKNYVQIAKDSIKEMYKQVGNLKTSKDGVARRGLIVRHLILPNNLENSFKALEHIREIDKDIYIYLMSQYEPVYRAKDFPEINRNITKKESEKVFDHLVKLGFENGWVQELESHSYLLPDFTKDNPFNYIEPRKGNHGT
jgi:putative pyruvate formate lyase activating enzyme